MRDLFVVPLFLMLAACSITEVAVDKINDEAVMRYCDGVSPGARAELRVTVAAECDDCGVAVRCPGETWEDVLAPLTP